MSHFLLSGFGDEIAKDLKTQLSVMAMNGIRYIELREVNGKEIVDFTPDERKEIKKELDSAGFRVSSIGSSVGKSDIGGEFAKPFDRFRRAMETAQFFGAPYLRIFSFFIPKNKDPKAFRGSVMERMNRFCEEIEGSGIRLLSENELDIYGDTPERCLDIVQTLGYERIGLLFDPANFIDLIEKVEIYPYAWHLLRDYVDYLHLKDAVHIDDMLRNHHEVRPVGYGEGNIGDILRELDEKGYDGFLSVEPHLTDYPGYEKLEQRMTGTNIPEGNPRKFTVAAAALKELLCKTVGPQWNSDSDKE